MDEVLAVGDINFQKKCLGKMGDVARAGRTIVLVTHQMNQIRRLCHRVVWIDEHTVRMDGPTNGVLAAYESALARDRTDSAPRGRSNINSRFLRWEISDPASDDPHILKTFGAVTIKFVAELMSPIHNGEHGIALFSSDGQLMWSRAEQNLNLNSGTQTFSHVFPSLPLRPGSYEWRVTIWSDGEMLDLWDCLPEMTIATEVYQHHMDEWNGILNFPVKLEVNRRG